MDEATLFKLVDATGGGACELDVDAKIVRASPRFLSLTGATEAIGRSPDALMGEMPALDEVAGEADADTPVFRQLGSDGVVRELAPALFRVEGGHWLVLIDRSSEARLKRRQARLGRQIDDLRAELEAQARAPVGARIRPMRELSARLDEALERARRYKHHVTVLRIELDTGGRDRDKDLLGCIRNVDDVGRIGPGSYAILLPHTDLPGGKIVGERVAGRLDGTKLGVGVAQALGKETGSALVGRAEGACRQAFDGVGGVLLAVDVL